jgi:hypothetical protein
MGDATRSAPLLDNRTPPSSQLPTIPPHKTTPIKINSKIATVEHPTEEGNPEVDIRKLRLQTIGRELDFQWLGPMDPDAFLSKFLPNGEPHPFSDAVLKSFVTLSSEKYNLESIFSKQLVCYPRTNV